MAFNLVRNRNEHLVELRQFCQSECDFNSQSDIQKHLALMGRLALLGEVEPLYNFQQELQKRNLWEKTEKQLTQKWLHSEKKWIYFEGKKLAKEIAFVQDCVGVMKYLTNDFSKYAKNCWNYLLKNVKDNTVLDDQAFSSVEDFFVNYNIPKEGRLETLSKPLISTMLVLMDSVPSFNPVTYEAKWNDNENLYEIDAQEKGTFYVQFDDQPDKACFRVFPCSNAISFLTGIGTKPVVHDENNPEMWFVPYGPNMKKDDLKLGFTLRFVDGSKATILLDKWIISPNTIVTERNNEFNQYVRDIAPSMLAARTIHNRTYRAISWKLEKTGTEFVGTFISNAENQDFDEFWLITDDKAMAGNITKIILGGREFSPKDETSWTLPLKDILEYVNNDTGNIWTLEVYLKDNPTPYFLNCMENGSEDD